MQKYLQPNFAKNLCMKTSLLYCLLLLITWCSSCRSLSYFDSPNNLRNIEGSLFLQNGRTYEGKLVIETENLFGRPVKLFVDDDKKPMQFSLNDVKGYAARNAYYELREIREGVSIGRQLYFMRRLTPENSRIHLFEFLKKEQSTDIGAARSRVLPAVAW
jgi:hypothetical protein